MLIIVTSGGEVFSSLSLVNEFSNLQSFETHHDIGKNPYLGLPPIQPRGE